MSIPVFDHEKPASMNQIGNMRTLEQDGHSFSFAEWNRMTGRFEPEPVYLTPGQKSFDEMKEMGSTIILRMDKLEAEMGALRTAIVNKIGLTTSTPVTSISTSPYEDAYLTDLPPLPDIVPPDEASAKKTRGPRKPSGKKTKSKAG